MVRKFTNGLYHFSIDIPVNVDFFLLKSYATEIISENWKGKYYEWILERVCDDSFITINRFHLNENCHKSFQNE